MEINQFVNSNNELIFHVLPFNKSVVYVIWLDVDDIHFLTCYELVILFDLIFFLNKFCSFTKLIVKIIFF